MVFRAHSCSSTNSLQVLIGAKPWHLKRSVASEPVDAENVSVLCLVKCVKTSAVCTPWLLQHITANVLTLCCLFSQVALHSSWAAAADMVAKQAALPMLNMPCYLLLLE